MIIWKTSINRSITAGMIRLGLQYSILYLVYNSRDITDGRYQMPDNLLTKFVKRDDESTPKKFTTCLVLGSQNT